jgi:ketosteroid isomerase-like protein
VSRAPRLRVSRPLAAAAALIALLPLCAEAQPTSDEDAIRRVRAESNAAIDRQDVPGILASLHPDYRVTTSSGALLASPAELGEAIAAQFDAYPDATYVRTAETIELGTSGPVASEAGTWVGSWTSASGPFRTGGRYVAYWVKSDGEWQIFAELFVPLFCEGADCD